MSSIKSIFCYIKNAGNEHYQNLWCLSLTDLSKVKGTRIKPSIIVWKNQLHRALTTCCIQAEPDFLYFRRHLWQNVNTVVGVSLWCLVVQVRLRFHELCRPSNKPVQSMFSALCEHRSGFILRFPQALMGGFDWKECEVFPDREGNKLHTGLWWSKC